VFLDNSDNDLVLLVGKRVNRTRDVKQCLV
jgi:hypothetical protein